MVQALYLLALGGVFALSFDDQRRTVREEQNVGCLIAPSAFSSRNGFIKRNVATCIKNNQALGEGCPGLLRLDVAGCDAVTDAGLSWMSKGCPALEYLDIAGCVKARLL